MRDTAPTRLELIDTVAAAYYELYLKARDAYERRSSVDAAFSRSWPSIARLRQGPDLPVGSEVGAAVDELLETVRAVRDPSLMLSWLGLVPALAAEHLRVSPMSAVVRATETWLQQSFRLQLDVPGVAEWRFFASVGMLYANLELKVDKAPWADTDRNRRLALAA